MAKTAESNLWRALLRRARRTRLQGMKTPFSEAGILPAGFFSVGRGPRPRRRPRSRIAATAAVNKRKSYGSLAPVFKPVKGRRCRACFVAAGGVHTDVRPAEPFGSFPGKDAHALCCPDRL